MFLGVKEGNSLLEGGGHKGQLMTASEYTNQIAEIQQKQQKTKRHASLSSDNFRYVKIKLIFVKFDKANPKKILIWKLY